MKQLLSVAVMVLVTLVGMVDFSRAGNEVSALQATANPTTGAVIEPQATVNAGTEYNWTAYYYPNNGAVTEMPATLNAGVQVKPRMYYLTVNGFTGGEAIKACDPRFHMASISEIQDPSDLQYVNGSTIAYYLPAYDQAFGPPSNHMGWVRSGVYSRSGFAYPCDVYFSSSDQQSDTTMSLYAFWYDPTAVADPYTPHTYMGWHAADHPCSEPEPVWCVENPENPE